MIYQYFCPECGMVAMVKSTASELPNFKCTCGKTVTMTQKAPKVPTTQQNQVAPTTVAEPKIAKPVPPKIFNPSTATAAAAATINPPQPI